MATFSFHPQWKEELVCTGPGGTFILELPMGKLTAILPTEEKWRECSPLWARGLWPVLRDELECWCKANKARFVVDESARVW